MLNAFHRGQYFFPPKADPPSAPADASIPLAEAEKSRIRSPIHPATMISIRVRNNRFFPVINGNSKLFDTNNTVKGNTYAHMRTIQ